MKRILKDHSQLWKIALETAAIIGICALVFVGITQAAYSTVTNQTQTVDCDAITRSMSKTPAVPAGYFKADYQLKLGQYSEQPGAKDMSKEEAAELGAQDLWKIFGLDLNGKTIEMTYNGVTSTHPRAEWTGIVNISDNHSYYFRVDAVTGEHRNTHMDQFWDADFNVGMDISLIKNHSQYVSLAKAAAEKYQLISGKVVSVEYYGQGSSRSRTGAQNADIQMRVKSENGEQVQLSFSRYNQEFLGVDYDCWVKECAVMEKEIIKRARAEHAKKIIIDDKQMEDAQEKEGFWFKEIDQTE